MYWRTLSIWYLLATPIAGALSVMGEFKVAGKNHTGFMWLSLLIVAWYLLALGALWTLDRRALALWSPWMVWFGFVWASLMWCSRIDSSNIQNSLQMSMPLVVGLLATAAIRTREDLRRLLRAYGVALALLAGYAVVFGLSVLSESEYDGPRAVALCSVLIGGVSYALLPRKRMVALLGWSICLAFTVVSGSRIASVALLSMPVLHLGYQHRAWNIFGIAIVLLLGVAVFNAPMIQERLFRSGDGDLGDLMAGDFDGAGRFEAWPSVWDEAWKRPWFGFGVGKATKFVPTIWQDMGHVHNDYLRLGLEFGLVGLSVFLLVAAWQMLILFRGVGHSAGVLHITWAAAWLGFVGLLITCSTDNTLVYNLFYTNPLFVLIGAAYGVSLAEQPKLANEFATEKHLPVELAAH